LNSWFDSMVLAFTIVRKDLVKDNN
jgi:hypothetical protein